MRQRSADTAGVKYLLSLFTVMKHQNKLTVSLLASSSILQEEEEAAAYCFAQGHLNSHTAPPLHTSWTRQHTR